MKRLVLIAAATAALAAPGVASAHLRGVVVKVEIRIRVRTQPAQAPVVNSVPGVVVDGVEGQLAIGVGTVTVENRARSVTLTVPAGFDLSRFRTGDSVEAKFTRDAAGKLTLAKLELRNADDDDEDDDHGGDDHEGHDGDHGGRGRH